MSWLRSASSFARQLSRSLDPRHDYEPQACYSSFCKHWQQAHDIIVRSQPQHLHDDVLGVVNHLEQMATLVVLEARAKEMTPHTAGPAACLDHLLTENLLDKLYEWAACTGKYENAVRLEQLKLFGILVSHYSSQVMAAEPFLRPLLKLLSGFRNELPPENLESQLVTVLNQICVALMQNMKFIDLFFLTTHTQNGSQAEFILVRLLLSSVHRDGATGAAARDALLLCAKMSARCPQLAECMAKGNTCVVLATGLSGLYSLLPRTLSERIHRLTPDDVNHVHKLTLFIDSLEFCNAVAQVAHQTIRRQLLDLLYQGFLVPVMGPALLQTKAGALQSGGGEQAAAVIYLELVVRCATSAGVLKPVLHFLLTHDYDGVKLADVLLSRLHGNSQLSLVTLSLMETLIDLNCEDVMLELVFKYLLNAHHLMVNHRNQIADPEPYRDAAIAFLGLSPRCCSRPLDKTREWVDEMALSGRRVLDYRKEDSSRKVNGMHGDIAMNNLVQEVKFNYGNPNETLFGNYHAYLCDARFEIVSRTLACANWSSQYETIHPPKKETNNNKETKEIDVQTNVKEQDSLISVCTSGYETLKTSDTSEKEPLSLTSLNEQFDLDNNMSRKTNEQIDHNEKDRDSLTSFGESSGYDSFRRVGSRSVMEYSQKDAAAHPLDYVPLIALCDTRDTSEKEPLTLTSLNEQFDLDNNMSRKNNEQIDHNEKDRDSLTSFGESSGYDSFRYKVEEGDEEGFAEDSFRKSVTKRERAREYDADVPLVRSWRVSAESIIGPLLSSLLKKAAAFLEAELAVNWRVSSILSKLMSFPTPLLTSLLCPGCLLAPNVPSLFQIISKLKEELDELTSGLDNTNELVDKARVFLIQREMALANCRGPISDDVSKDGGARAVDFRRVEVKRRTLSNSFSNIFGRRSTPPSPVPQNVQTHATYHNSSPQKRLLFTQEAYWNQSITLRSILNAVILDEWVKELAAICEEHALRLSADNYQDDTYLKTVAL